MKEQCVKEARSEIFRSIVRLDRWLERHDWKAFDPFDGLSSRYAAFLTGGRPRLRIALQQANRRFPLNVRPLLGIAPARSSKGMGFLARGYLALYKATGDETYRKRAELCLRWLEENTSPGYSGHAWGNHFDYESRGGRIPRGMPTVVWTGLIGQAFMDAYDTLGEKRYREVARSVCRFVLADLPHAQAEAGICIAYTPQPPQALMQHAIHNSNVIAAAILARVGRETHEPELLDTARKAVEFTVGCQLPEGGWYYGEAPTYHWVDSFHTGYVLESLHTYQSCSGDDTHLGALKRGYSFFIERFFKPDGTPAYYDGKTWPIDIQCASQGIQTLVALEALDARSIDVACRVALWTIRAMQDPSGYFYFRRYPLLVNRTPTLHWGQATMLLALAALYRRLDGGATGRGRDGSVVAEPVGAARTGGVDATRS
jgi:hypothetical protein